MSGQTIKALIWDMDGTLLNTLDDIVGAVNATLRQWGLSEKPKEELLQFIGYGARHLCHGATGFEGERLTHFLTEYRQMAIDRNDPETYIYPGIETLLRKSRQSGMKLGIYTNKPQKWCTKLANKFFGEGTFDAIYGTHEGGVLKPDPEGILWMCRQWEISPGEAVMIGDSPVDWETACNAHSLGICVSWGFRTRRVLEDAGAACIVDDSPSLCKAIGF